MFDNIDVVLLYVAGLFGVHYENPVVIIIVIAYNHQIWAYNVPCLFHTHIEYWLPVFRCSSI